MSSTLFSVQEHLVPCQHIREYPRATADKQEDVLYLSVKQYRPLDNLSSKPGDVTIIGAHANGFPKVCASNRHALRHHCHRLMEQSGTIRAAMGRATASIKSPWLSNTGNLDCRCIPPRHKFCAERKQIGR